MFSRAFPIDFNCPENNLPGLASGNRGIPWRLDISFFKKRGVQYQNSIDTRHEPVKSGF